MSSFEGWDKPAEPAGPEPPPPDLEPTREPPLAAESPQAGPADPWAQTAPSPPSTTAFSEDAAPPMAPLPADGSQRKGGRPGLRQIIVIAVVVGISVTLARVVPSMLFHDPIEAAARDMLQSLPADVRDRLVADIEEALSVQAPGLSKEGAQERMRDLSRKGFARVDDASAIRRLALQTTALGATDTATCAAYARASFGGTVLDPGVVLKMISSLSPTDLQEWFELSVAAIKLEVAGQPAPIVVTDADFQEALAPAFSSYTSGDTAAVQAVSSAPDKATDTEACDVVRKLYNSVQTLGPVDLAKVARFDIQ